MSWNLPPGCTPYHVEEAAGAFDDPHEQQEELVIVQLPELGADEEVPF